MRKAFILTILMAASALGWAGVAVVSSPDGKLQVTVSTDNGQASYAATLEGRPVLNPSALGLRTSIGDFTQGLRLDSSLTTPVSEHYTMRGTKASSARYEANRLTLALSNQEGGRLTIIFQVSNRDIALRYALPRQRHAGHDPKRAIVYGEATAFNLPEGSTTFLSPQIGPETGWEQTKPSYEETYSADAPMDVASQYGHGYIFPALFHIGGGKPAAPPSAGRKARAGKAAAPADGECWALISETGVGSNYCGAHLSDYQPGRGYAVSYPDAGENGGFGSPFAGIALPGETPWRTITVGTSLKPIVETTIAYDLVKPLYEPSTDYRPGRYTWSWLIWQDNSVNYDDQVRFVDLASAMGFEYCLVDNWWDTQIGRDRMAELARHAASKGVSLLLWYNSNGFWNDAPQGPRNLMHTAIAREREMKWLHDIGVKGIKVDFFGGDKQETMRLYEDILSDANRYGLQVVFHGCTLPRGWERMYPNFVASEAVLASENVFFNEESAIRQPFDLTLHPFCRNATAAMDWGGVIMNKYLSRDNKSRHSRKTTDIFELASGIVNQTSVQCVAMQPNNLGELPQFELDFLRQLPAAWDETRYLDGYPGRHVVMARRHGDRWYIAGLNALQEPLTLTLELPMPAGKGLTCLVDDPRGTPVSTPLKVDKRNKAVVTLQPNGGVVIY